MARKTRLKLARDNCQLTQGEVAEIMGVSVMTVSQLEGEADREITSPRRLEMLAAYVNALPEGYGKRIARKVYMEHAERINRAVIDAV